MASESANGASSEAGAAAAKKEEEEQEERRLAEAEDTTYPFDVAGFTLSVRHDNKALAQRWFDRGLMQYGMMTATKKA